MYDFEWTVGEIRPWKIIFITICNFSTEFPIAGSYFIIKA